MKNLSDIYACTIKCFHRIVRQITYEDMSHQASDWAPENLKIKTSQPETKPVRLNFKVAKKNRIHWIRRSMHQ